jgi:hypothetical protein
MLIREIRVKGLWVLAVHFILILNLPPASAITSRRR